ncbi:hypothetical protein CDAR_411541 [Caerostris darwini]|uniref:Uncharacterized protein n=1 Tax=Caerostris darwini TaxID=1538125 RepID=A0AAV4SFW4_9ARAC|nr:hypothetical protein CDAR_411541 [Caerostris darwini]
MVLEDMATHESVSKGKKEFSRGRRECPRKVNTEHIKTHSETKKKKMDCARVEKVKHIVWTVLVLKRSNIVWTVLVLKRPNIVWTVLVLKRPNIV